MVCMFWKSSLKYSISAMVILVTMAASTIFPVVQVKSESVIDMDVFLEIAREYDQIDMCEIVMLVQEFGRRLKQVSLLAAEDMVYESMKENYTDLVVSFELFEEWISDPESAPGRLTSSPWPDRIEIDSIERLSEGKYQVEGYVIEVTSMELERCGTSLYRPIVIEVHEIKNHWLIASVKVGPYS